ncbi:dye-decolorizing peroxidase precursor [Mycena belliarum]|uniref:Dye-decolorizing peroxidase n=1 Tax=Mycena belliarum TaxID=1033014 RepID=A0AAD6XT32_9AGAR|nr:dye-decolorizing peroxidase precursor [Mycena belliae]
MVRAGSDRRPDSHGRAYAAKHYKSPQSKSCTLTPFRLHSKMPCKAISTLLVVFLLFAGQFVAAHPGANDLPPRRRVTQGQRTKSLLINPPALPQLPTADAVAATDDPLNIDNIQADILAGMHKDKELFFFFSVNDATTFKSKLKSDILPLITTTRQILAVNTQPITAAVNIAFSSTGLVTLGVDSTAIGDSDFVAGQFSETDTIGDNPSLWNSAFTGTGIHGVFLLASDTIDNINTELANIQSILGSSITEIHRLQGAARPGSESGHEHFGFMDGIAQPAVNGFTNPVLPGQTSVNAGVFLLGEQDDPNQGSRPSWAVDGSFLVFRQLQQLVPEFNQFLTDHPLDTDTLTPEQGSELLGARMVGRWKSGAPVFLSPTADDPELGADRNRNNDFNYLIASDPAPGTENHFNQTRCPFSAHIRKVHPRGDLDPSVENQHFIIRSSIPYGPEVTNAEAASSTTSVDRGLAFVSYQSNIFNGFVFLQSIWINSVGFPFGKVDPTVGVDPIIGSLGGGPKNISGLDPAVPCPDADNCMGQLDVSHDVVLPRGTYASITSGPIWGVISY